MQDYHASNHSSDHLRIIGEARTSDHGKLLFKIAVNGAEVFLLIKTKGNKNEYRISIRDLTAFFSIRPP